ncbi:hypothetical protein R1sor_013417 [Riccia sorocarpa]|uniref:Uncharacterized protein n=1 Tax=Riccia sorocarpa TaxID=122646 RepID=A0ABD3H6H9_9MARC
MAAPITRLRYPSYRGKESEDLDAFIESLNRQPVLTGKHITMIKLGPQNTMAEVIATAEKYGTARRTAKKKKLKSRRTVSSSSEDETGTSSSYSSEEESTTRKHKSKKKAKRRSSSTEESSSSEEEEKPK